MSTPPPQVGGIWEPLPNEELVAELLPQRLHVRVLADAHLQLLHLVVERLVQVALGVLVLRALPLEPVLDLRQALVIVAEEQLVQ